MPPSLLFLILLLLLPVLALSSSPALNDDVLGLIVFKADLSSPSPPLSAWSEDDDDPCHWPGVKCSPSTRRVTDLALPALSLTGRLGRGLLQLRSLQKLSLPNNNLSGPLPPDLTRLDNLRSLDLSGNRLSGPIPDRFFDQCTSLRFVSLAGNRLSGPIPDNVGKCSTLVTLNLSSNQLEGRLPSGLWRLAGLKNLDLSGNSLAGEVPGGVSRLVSLRKVRLSRNRLSGPLPEEIGKCLLLREIDFGGNLLSGRVPEAMRRLALLTSLVLNDNELSGEVPAWTGELKRLERLDLAGNGLSGSLPESMAGGERLLEVDLSRNSLTGGLPLWAFELGLRRFSASGNRLSGSVRVSNSSGRTLEVLDLSSNGFAGGIPVEIGEVLAGLKVLNLSGNWFSGSVPVSLGELRTLEVVDLSGNKLDGRIPVEIGGAVALKELRLERNYLSGGIPSQIGNCYNLTLLILSQNNLSGSIPPTLSNLTNLQTIDLSHNRLTGSLPNELSNLPNLLSFNISHNLLSGALPGGHFFNTIAPSSLFDNPGLCGSVVNRSCPTVLPKPLVLNPNSTSNSSANPAGLPNSLRHKKIIFSISTLIAIGAATVIAFGVITITILNHRVRSSTSHSAVALTASDDYSTQSPASYANSGKLVMFSGNHPDFTSGTQAILNKDCELGRGGFGAVYKTILRDGRPVAIKKLTVSSLVKSQEDFKKEVKKLGKITHPNLVALEGYYWTPSLQLLICEFVSGGSLYKHLHESSESTSLSWQARFDIILGTARSLAHLHRHDVIHYNLKSSNVLIDGAGEPKVGDYGLAKLLPMLDRYILSSKVQSALGYMAPEFACRTVRITEKCDVFGFGVLVLEVVTGRRPVEYMEDDVVVLCDVVREALEGGKVEEWVDGKLGGRFPAEEAIPVIKLGLICTSQVPSNRPEMGEVVKILEMIRCPQESQGEELC